MSMEHTPEPWTHQIITDVPGVNGWRIDSGSRPFLAWMFYDSKVARDADEATPKRACAAVNACAGIPTSALESGVIAEMRAVILELLNAGIYRTFRLDEKHVAARDKAESILAKLTPQ